MNCARACWSVRESTELFVDIWVEHPDATTFKARLPRRQRIRMFVSLTVCNGRTNSDPSAKQDGSCDSIISAMMLALVARQIHRSPRRPRLVMLMTVYSGSNIARPTIIPIGETSIRTLDVPFASRSWDDGTDTDNDGQNNCNDLVHDFLLPRNLCEFSNDYCITFNTFCQSIILVT